MSISVVLNSWKRQVNIPRIVSSLSGSGYVTEILIWDNNPGIYLDPRPMKQPKLRVINSSKDFGLSTRWILGQLAQNDCVITQDDDFLIPATSINQMYEVWKMAPDVMHGISGRTVKLDGTYYAQWIKEGKAPIIATGFAALHRKYCVEYPKVLYEITKYLGPTIRGYVDTAGDDMLMSYLILSIAKQPGRVHRIPYTELKGTTDPMLGIHTRQGFWEKRTAMVRAFEKYFKVNSQQYA